MDTTPAKALLKLKNRYCKTNRTLEDLKSWVTSILDPEDSYVYQEDSFWYNNAHLKFLNKTKTFSIVYSNIEEATHYEICLPLQNYLEHFFGIEDFDRLTKVAKLGPPDWDLITSKITEHIHLCTRMKPENFGLKTERDWFFWTGPIV